MTTTEKPSIIIAYWDTSDPNNKGWSWRAHWFDEDGEHEHEESGGFDGRSNLSDASVTSRARKAAGQAGRRSVSVRIHR
jgi:hypothetical protein